MSNFTFLTDITTARSIMETTLKGRAKGARATALRAFLAADTDQGREDVVEQFSPGYVRRSLREAAVFLDRKGDHNAADVFWALRDDIDLDGDVFALDTTVEDVA